MAHCSGPALRGYNDLSSHVAQGLQEGVFLSLVDLVKHLPVHSCSLQPGSMGPGGSRRPMANSSTNSTHHLQVGAWSQTGAGNKPSYLADHLAAASGSKGWYFKMEPELWARPFFFFFFCLAEDGWVLSGFCRRGELWVKEFPHSTRLFIIQIKTFLLSHQPLPLEFAFWWQQAARPHFCSVTINSSV